MNQWQIYECEVCGSSIALRPRDGAAPYMHCTVCLGRLFKGLPNLLGRLRPTDAIVDNVHRPALKIQRQPASQKQALAALNQLLVSLSEKDLKTL